MPSQSSVLCVTPCMSPLCCRDSMATLYTQRICAGSDWKMRLDGCDKKLQSSLLLSPHCALLSGKLISVRMLLFAVLTGEEKDGIFVPVSSNLRKLSPHCDGQIFKILLGFHCSGCWWRGPRNAKWADKTSENLKKKN